ncbi:lysosome-associated membrane glycoprotein 1-like [Branchiostoma floridae x Branchiostoma japonicum]
MFHVEYQLKNGKVRNASYVLPENCTITGSCNQHVANISLSFGGAFNMTAIFTSSGKTYSLDTVSVGYEQSPSYFPGTRNPRRSHIETVKNLNLLQTDIGRSYLCKSQQWFHVGSSIVLEIIEFQIQPFGVINGHFSVPDECDKDYPVTMYPMENATLVTTPTTTEGNFTSIGPASTILPSNHTTRPVITTSNVPPSSPVYPPVPQGHYVVYNASGHKCLLANMGIRFHINYTKENDMLGTAVFDVPPNAEASGVCGNSHAHSTLTLTFYDAMFNLTLSFSREHNDDHATMYHGITAHFFFVEVPVIFLDTLTPDKPRKISNTSLNLFPTDAGHSYKCSKDVSVALTKNVSVAFRNVQVQPFDVQSGQFSPAEECADDSEGGSDKVLIIVVGVVLLVIAVEIGVAGVIGRRTLNSKYKRLENIVE